MVTIVRFCENTNKFTLFQQLRKNKAQIKAGNVISQERYITLNQNYYQLRGSAKNLTLTYPTNQHDTFLLCS